MNVHPAGVRTRRCPRCWSENLRVVGVVGAVGAAGAANLLCTACHRCWRVEAGYLVEVNPLACSGCIARAICRAR